MIWSVLRSQILRKVNDSSNKYADVALDSANDALRLIASIHTGVPSTAVVIGDGESTTFGLPGNIVSHDSVVGIYDPADDMWLSRIVFAPGKPMSDGYYIWSNSIVFNPAIYLNREYIISYLAMYPEITSDDDIIPGEPWMLEAIKLYAAGRTLEVIASAMAIMGNYRTRVDSGTPEDQPLITLSKLYIKEFWEILNAHPAPTYG